MRGNLIRLLMMVVLGSQGHAQTSAKKASNPSPVTWRDLELELGAKEQTKYDHVIDLGQIGAINTLYTTPDPADAACVTRSSYPVEQEPDRIIDVKVTHRGAQMAKMTAVYAGSRLRAGWLSAGNSIQETIALEPEQSATLRITFGVDDGKTQDMSLVSLLSESRPVTNISLDYAFLKQFVDVEYSSGMVLSGPSEAFSPDYWLGTGPAPPMYTLYKACLWLTGDRACNSWSTCNWIRNDDVDVSIKFALQGHKESSSAKSSEGHLRAVYRLSSKQPELR